jgi:hypothetical protein
MAHEPEGWSAAFLTDDPPAFTGSTDIETGARDA